MIQAPPPKPIGSKIQAMFAQIAKDYDKANHFCSLGVDYYWRHALARAVKKVNPSNVLDLATGSGDVVFTLIKHLNKDTAITGVDFCAPLLEVADSKKRAKYPQSNITFTHADCMQLPLEDASFDAITLAFGYRNFENRSKGLQEILRVLRPGGHLFILEFSQPYTCIKPLFLFYFKYILIPLGARVTSNQEAYKYLCSSIDHFPSAPKIADELEACGFGNVCYSRYLGGVVALHKGKK